MNSNVPENALVSCLCVTNNRVDFLKRAVECYLNQTYRFRELIVAYNADDHDTHRYLGSLSETSIYPVELPAAAEITLGAMRNRSVDAARGQYVAIWDDDDWHGPERLAQQMKAIRLSVKQNCVLSRVLLYDAVQDKAYVSEQRCWEGTLVGCREKMPRYEKLSRAEDTPVVEKLRKCGELAFLEASHHYVYVYHGCNTSDCMHWNHSLVRHSNELSEKETFRIQAIL